MSAYLDEVLSHQLLTDRVIGGSALEEVMRQANVGQRLAEHYNRYEHLLGYSQVAEAMKQANLGLALAEQYGDYTSGRYLAAMGVPPLSSTQRFIKQMEETSAAARMLMLGESHGAMASLMSNEAYSSLVRWQDLIAPNHAQAALEAMQLNAFNAASGYVENLSGTASLACEFAAAHHMMHRPEWAVLNDQVLRSLSSEFAHLQDGNSIYRELFRRLEQAGGLEELPSAETEAENYFEAITSFLSRYIKCLTPHDLLVIIHVLAGVIFHLHLAHQLQAGLDDVRTDIEEAKAQVNAHTSAVVDALWEKLEPKFAELSAIASRRVRWMAGDRGVAVRRAPRNGAQTVAPLMPDQVVTEVGHEGKWIQIEFQDHRAGVPKVGWALKKHLIRVTPQARD